MRYVLPAVLVVLMALVYMPAAQEDPIPWLDFGADSLTFSFPAPDSIRVTAHYSIYNNMYLDTVIVGDIGFFLDGIAVGGKPVDVTRSLNNCYIFDTVAECKGECYYATGPPIQFGNCIWYTPPPDSIFVASHCVCWKSFEESNTFHYSGEDNASFELDCGGMVVEADEYNNSVSVNVGSVATEPSTWGRIKALYGEE